MKAIKLFSSLSVAALALSPAFAADVTAPTSLAGCVECHGVAGVAAIPAVPHLNGQLPDFLVESMKSYALGSRPTDVSLHKTFPADELPTMAAYYTAQKNQARPRHQPDPALLAKGEQIYASRCMDCHIDNGRGSDKDAPLLAGQELTFLIQQTLAFKSGVRKFPFMMDDAYRGLTADELSATAHFFAAQDANAPPPGKKKWRRG